MQSLIRSIPTYKWLLVLPQLTSRMCHVQADVQVCQVGWQLAAVGRCQAPLMLHTPAAEIGAALELDGIHMAEVGKQLQHSFARGCLLTPTPLSDRACVVLCPAGVYAAAVDCYC